MIVIKPLIGEVTPPAIAVTLASPSASVEGTVTLNWYRPVAERPPNAIVAVAPLNWITGNCTKGAAPAWSWPFTAAGLVTPKPLPYRIINSPGAAGVPAGVEVAVPMGELLA